MIFSPSIFYDGNQFFIIKSFRKSRSRLALKIISRENAIGKEDLIKSELSIMQRISHEFIVRMFDYWQFDGSYYLSLELITVYF